MEYSNVKLFAARNKDLADAMKEYAANCKNEKDLSVKSFSNHSKEDMEKAINKMYFSALEEGVGYGVSKFGDGKSAVQKFANMTEVKEFANSIRDDMIDMILPDSLLTGALPYFCETKFADLGDTIKFDIENNSLFTVSQAGYRKRSTNLQKLYRSTVTMTGINHEITVGSDLFEILIGEASIAKDVMKANISIQQSMLFNAYDVFDTAVTGLTGNLTTNFTETGAMNLAATITAYNQGKKAMFVGTPVALKSLLPANSNFRFMLDSDYVKTGYVQNFNGYDVLPLQQVADPMNATPYSLKLNDHHIYVLSPASQKIVQLGVFGGSYSHTDAIYDNANKLQLSTTEKAWDVAVATNSVIGLINLAG